MRRPASPSAEARAPTPASTRERSERREQHDAAVGNSASAVSHTGPTPLGRADIEGGPMTGPMSLRHASRCALIRPLASPPRLCGARKSIEGQRLFPIRDVVRRRGAATPAAPCPPRDFKSLPRIVVAEESMSGPSSPPPTSASRAKHRGSYGCKERHRQDRRCEGEARRQARRPRQEGRSRCRLRRLPRPLPRRPPRRNASPRRRARPASRCPKPRS